MSKPEFVDVIIQDRIYHFRDGHTIRIDQVVKLGLSKSGYHFLETADKKKFVVRPDWTHFEFIAEDWSTTGGPDLGKPNPDAKRQG